MSPKKPVTLLNRCAVPLKTLVKVWVIPSPMPLKMFPSQLGPMSGAGNAKDIPADIADIQSPSTMLVTRAASLMADIKNPNSGAMIHTAIEMRFRMLPQKAPLRDAVGLDVADY